MPRSRQVEVASFTDAWIETYLAGDDTDSHIESHLLQMRGLKPYDNRETIERLFESHLLQMRGLKP